MALRDFSLRYPRLIQYQLLEKWYQLHQRCRLKLLRLYWLEESCLDRLL
jgi:hypothetical protein